MYMCTCHLLCLDGIYVRGGDTLRFEPAPAPTRAELESLVQRVYARVMKWLSRRGLLRRADDADASNAPPSQSPAEALASAGMERGTLLTVRESGDVRRRHGGCFPFRLEAVEAVVTSSLTTTGKAEQVAPNVLSIAHWERILEGELYASTARIDWRTLLKRTFDTDLRVCVRCGGRLVIRAVVTESASVANLLAALRRPRAPPAAA